MYYSLTCMIGEDTRTLIRRYLKLLCYRSNFLCSQDSIMAQSVIWSRGKPVFQS